MESRVLERMVESRESKDHKGPIGFLFNIYFYCMCVFLHVHAFHLCARGCGGRKRESDPMKMELQIDLSGHVGAGN